MDELNTTTGALALAALVVAVIAFGLAVAGYLQTRRLRAAQQVVIGEGGAQDLVGHAAALSREFAALHAYVEDVAGRLEARMSTAEDRLDGSVAFHGLVRYDAYGEMSGRQSTTIALLDSHRSGVILSSIHHRDQARLYAKHVTAGTGDLALSPEEQEAVRLALAGESQALPG